MIFKCLMIQCQIAANLRFERQTFDFNSKPSIPAANTKYSGKPYSSAANSSTSGKLSFGGNPCFCSGSEDARPSSACNAGVMSAGSHFK